jgi:hypothetical protein
MRWVPYQMEFGNEVSSHSTRLYTCGLAADDRKEHCARPKLYKQVQYAKGVCSTS